MFEDVDKDAWKVIDATPRPLCPKCCAKEH